MLQLFLLSGTPLTPVLPPSTQRSQHRNVLSGFCCKQTPCPRVSCLSGRSRARGGAGGPTLTDQADVLCFPASSLFHAVADVNTRTFMMERDQRHGSGFVNSRFVNTELINAASKPTTTRFPPWTDPAGEEAQIQLTGDQ